MPSPPAIGWVSIICDDPAVTLTVRLGPERPDVTAGYGGWNEVARPKRTTVTTWTGMPARRMTLSILFTDFRAGRSVERQIQQLERMALPRSGGQPPTVKVLARGGHVPYQGRTWVIDALEWGDAIMNPAGDRVRQAATITFLQYVADDLIAARTRKSPAQKRRDKAHAKKGEGRKKGAREKRKPAKRGRKSVRKGHHHVRGVEAATAATTPAYDGEDLMSIAARELDDARRWREIADLNGIRDPRAITVGQILRLP